MIVLKQKVYEWLKFAVKFIPLLVTFLGTVLLTCGVADSIVSIVLTILGAVGSLAEGVVEICKANAYKLKNQEGEVIDNPDVIAAANDEEEDIEGGYEI